MFVKAFVRAVSAKVSIIVLGLQSVGWRWSTRIGQRRCEGPGKNEPQQRMPNDILEHAKQHQRAQQDRQRIQARMQIRAEMTFDIGANRGTASAFDVWPDPTGLPDGRSNVTGERIKPRASRKSAIIGCGSPSVAFRAVLSTDTDGDTMVVAAEYFPRC